MNSRSVTTYILVFLLTVSIFSTVGTVFFHLKDDGYKTQTAVLSEVEDATPLEAVFVRDEKVVKTYSNGTLCYNVEDGAKVGVGSKIADVFDTKAQAEAAKSAKDYEAQAKALKSIQNPGESLSVMPEKVCEKIDQSYKDIIDLRDDGNIRKLVSKVPDFMKLVNTYQALTDDTVNFGDEISILESKALDERNIAGDPSESVKAAGAGYFIGYTDGYENELKPDDISDLTEKKIKSIKDSKTTKDAVGKIVSGSKWYAVGYADIDPEKFRKGDKLKIKFPSCEDMADGKVESVKKADKGGKSMIVVSSTDFQSDFVAHRKENIELVTDEYRGIVVSKDYLRFNNAEVEVTGESGEEETRTKNVKGVYILVGEEAEFRKLDIIYETKDFVVSAPNKGDGYLELYDSIITEGDKLYGN